MGRFRLWLESANSVTIDLSSYEKELRGEVDRVFDYIQDKKDDATIEDYEPWIQDLLKDSYKNMEIIQKLILDAISRVAEWNGTPVVVQAEASQDQANHVDLEGGATYAQVSVGQAPFTIWEREGGKWEIPEIIEAGFGEEDFFTNPQMKEDYYNLINEIQNPGHSSKEQIMTLYTARPVRDREQYMNATIAPANIFLTTDWKEADALAYELPGGERDVWKIRIDTRGLTKMLDMPLKKHFMVNRDTPAKFSPYYLAEV